MAGIVTALLAAGTAQAEPAVPTFVNGLSQAVFAQGSANWVNHELWVETTMDTDFDGQRDRVHVDVSRPTETETDGLKVPVIYEDSPYYAGGADITNWAVDHPIGVPPATRPQAPFFAAGNTSPVISTIYENAWVPRGFAVVHSESPGTGHSDGCPNSGAPIETEGAKAVIDWLNGRAKGFTTRTGDVEVTASWTTGKVGMIGTSYNGTLPIAAASTGVQGLEAIVPISAISDWYDYYRANGMVRAPGGFQGEDLDVLTEYIYSRADETDPRMICWPTIEQVAANQDRATGNRSAFWQERNYMKDVGNVRAATLLAHGNNDFNVMTKHAAQFYEALKAQGVPHQFFFHQGGHGGSPPDVLLNYWFTRYLWGQQNGVENMPKSWVVREAASCPPRQSTVAGDHVNTATLAVADVSPFRIGFTLTVPQTNANGTITNTTRIINNIAGNTLTLASAVATAAGQRVVDGATVSLVCGNPNPTPYPEWPDPATGDAVLHLAAGGTARGGLTLGAGSGGPETLSDDAGVTAASLMNAAERGQPPALRDQPPDRAGPHQRHAARVPERVVQRREGESDRDPGQPAGERQRHDPHARLDRPREPQLGLDDRAGDAGDVLPARLRPPAEGHHRPGRPPARPDGALERPRAHRPPGAGHAGDPRRRRQRPLAPGRGRRQGARDGDRRRPRGGNRDRHRAGHAEPHGRRSRELRRVHAGPHARLPRLHERQRGQHRGRGGPERRRSERHARGWRTAPSRWRSHSRRGPATPPTRARRTTTSARRRSR